MEHTSFIELSRSALASNLKFIKELLGDTTFSSVVKGNAYGHGIATFCPLLYNEGQRHFSVFSASEAEEVLKVVPGKCTILIMGMIENHQLAWAIENEIEFFVFELDRLEHAIKTAKNLDRVAKVHVEVETGMNRTGFDNGELKTALELINANSKHIQLLALCSHLAGAESIANYKRIKDQIKTFNKIKRKHADRLPENIIYHLACSAASLRYPKTQLDLARIGILQYGYFPTRETLVHYLTKKGKFDVPLKRVISWKSSVMDTKKIKAGKFVGYGTSFFTNVETLIALVPVGYSHGFSRSLSNQGKVLIRGQRFDVIGTVNMNMLAVDISENPEIVKGDEVVLIGHQGKLEISVASFGEYSQLLNYELLVRLPKDIPRHIVD